MLEHDAGSVTFYWRPGCPFCFALRLRLRRKRLPLHEINIWQDTTTAARVRTITGGDETVPTVVVGSTALVNPTVAEVLKTARAQTPQVLEQRERNQTVSTRSPVRWLTRLFSKSASE